MMRSRSLRLAVVIVGLAAVVYGTVTVDGLWATDPRYWGGNTREPFGMVEGWYYPPKKCDWIASALVAIGLGLVAVGSWPRRRRPAAAR